MILFSLISLVSGLQAGQGLIIVMEEERLPGGQKLPTTIYLEPDRAAVHGPQSRKSKTMVYLADEKLLRIIDHRRKTFREFHRSGTEPIESQTTDIVAEVHKSVTDRIKTMDLEQRALSEHHLIGRYCQIRMAHRSTVSERSKIIYSRSSGSATIGGHDCDWYVGRRGEEMVSSVCVAPRLLFDFAPADFQVIRQIGELFGMDRPGSAAIMISSSPDLPDTGKFPGVPIEQTHFCYGQALLKNTIKEYRRGEIDPQVYAAPSGYRDLTCRDEGLCN